VFGESTTFRYAFIHRSLVKYTKVRLLLRAVASSAIQSSHSVMTLFLNIVLLVVGTIATAVAFGGDTWKKGRESLLRRITWRGWVSLASLLVALCAGIAKELLTKSQMVLRGFLMISIGLYPDPVI
jgi:Mn2+/Fe2+ NRAMP family transporter